MARRGRPPKKKKQATITAFTTATPSSSSSSRGRNKSATAKATAKANANEDGDLPEARTWIYSTSTATAGDGDDGDAGNDNNGAAAMIDSEEGYEHYLSTRVQRPVVRSLPNNYLSYFDNDNDNDNSSGGFKCNKEENQSATLQYTHVPLPPIVKGVGQQSNSTDNNDNSSNNDNAAYAKYTTPIITKDSRLAKFHYDYNYSTHVPNKNLISYDNTGGGAVGSELTTGYSLQLPLVGGTVIGYSPPLYDEYTANEVLAHHCDHGGEEEGIVASNEVEEAEFDVDRQRLDVPLFRVLWDGYSTRDIAAARDTEGTGDIDKGNQTIDHPSMEAVGYIEDLTLPELLSCLASSTSRGGLSSKQRLNHKKSLAHPYDVSNAISNGTSSTAEGTEGVVLPHTLLTSTASSIHAKTSATTIRKQLALEWKLEHTILPTLVTLAALELRKEVAMKVRMEILVERRRLREKSGLDGIKKKKGKKKDGSEIVLNENGGDFNYYARHPNQYMSGFVAPPPLPSDDEDDDSDDENLEEAAALGGGGGEGGHAKAKSKTKLSAQELVTYHSRLMDPDSRNGVIAGAFAPSKIAERARVACSMAYDYLVANGKLDEYYAAAERRKELEQKERERLSREVTGGGFGGDVGGAARRASAGGIDGTGEVRRSSRARTAVSYLDGGDAVEDALKNHEGGANKSAAVKGGSGELPRENVMGGSTARYLLKMLGLVDEEESKFDEENADENAMDEDIEEVEDDGDDHPEDVSSDPFFEPSPLLIIDQLGRKHRYLSPSSVQAAIVRSIEDQGGEGPIDTPTALLDEELVEEMEKNGVHYVSDLIVTTDDKVNDLGHFEPSSFSRCRFAPRMFIAENEEEEEDEHEEVHGEALSEAEIQAREEAAAAKKARHAARKLAKAQARQKKVNELERLWRQQKAYEIWRFRCIHGDGCTIFPKWSSSVGDILRELSDKNRVGDSAAASVSIAEGNVAEAPTVAASNDTAISSGAETTTASALTPAPAATTTATQGDEALARSLAAAAESTVNDEPLAKRRRTTRRGGGGDAEPVFYGGHQSMSRDQLLETLIRLLYQASNKTPGSVGSSSLMDLKRLVFPDSYDSSRGGLVEMKKLRSVLGQLVYKNGNIGRLTVNVNGDKEVLDFLEKEGKLIKFIADEIMESEADVKVVGSAATTEGVKSEEAKPASEPVDAVKSEGPVKPEETVKSEEPASIINNETKIESEVGAKVAVAVTAAATKAVKSESAKPASELGDAVKCEGPASIKSAQVDAAKPGEKTVADVEVGSFKIDPHLKSQVLSLESYIVKLHRTELSLRKSLMKAIDKGSSKDGGASSLLQISTSAIATAADETEGTADAEDWQFFIPKMSGTGEATSDAPKQNGEGIKWTSGSSHPLIGGVIFRPQSSPLRPAQDAAAGNSVAEMTNDRCHWYRIVSYTPSVKAVEDITLSSESAPSAAAQKQEAKANTIVDRRCRFRAVPVAESDIDSPPMDMDTDEEDMEYMILTEGQAHAGIDAGILHRRIEKKEPGNQPVKAQSQGSRLSHPFRNGHGSRVMLTPDNGNGGDISKFDVLYGVIAGYDHVVEPDGSIKNKVLILLEEDEKEASGEDEEDKENAANDSAKSSIAFWAVTNPEGTILKDLVPTSASPTNLWSAYLIQEHEYYTGSPAYSVCESIITYLNNHSKSGPFMAPVDPIALGIPDYHTVIKEPMDISTLAENLRDGKYSRIPPKPVDQGNANEDEDDGTNHPVYRMAYGPFYEAVMLIFDNCIKYNSAETWIGNEAVILKKNVEKKFQTVVSKAVWQGGGGAKTSISGPTLSRGAKNSIYAEEDSDVDMYEYESDYEDDYEGGGKRRSRKGKNKPKAGGGGSRKSRAKEDTVSKAIEQPFMMPEQAHEFGTGGAFPHLKVLTNVGKYALGQEWSCRYITEDATAAENEEDEAEKEDEEDEMLMLMQLQQEEDDAPARRSTRARHAPKNYADDEIVSAPNTSSSPTQAPVSLPGVEYYLMNDETLQLKTPDGEEAALNEHDDRLQTVCRSRLGAEGILETIHELFYAKLYREHSPNALILDSGLGNYADGSFPPYLGRVIPAPGSNIDDDEAIVWEIRDQYLIPALRWVLRGLIRSGHLQEVDGTLTDGALEDAPARTSFGAGVVVPSHEYYYNKSYPPYDLLDEKEILRKRRQDAMVDSESSSEDEVEMSEYEKARAARVARNAERLKALGLA